VKYKLNMADNLEKQSKGGLTRREFIKFGTVTGGAAILSACIPSSALKAAEKTFTAAEGNLASGMSQPLAIKPGDLDPGKYDPNLAIGGIEGAYAAQGFNPGAIEGAAKTADWWNKYGSLAREVLFRLDAATRRPTQYYDFSGEHQSPRPPDEQLEIFYELVDATRLDSNRKMVLNIGPAGTISPIETAINQDQTTVFAVDVGQLPPWEYVPEVAQIPDKENQTSFATFFSLDVFTIDSDRIGGKVFDRVDLFAPNPYQTDVILKGCLLGKRLVMVPDPDIIDLYKLDDLKVKLDAIGCKAELVPMNIGEIRQLTGASHSWALKDFPPDMRFDVLLAASK